MSFDISFAEFIFICVEKMEVFFVLSLSGRVLNSAKSESEMTDKIKIHRF